jgi:hypothetical protein
MTLMVYVALAYLVIVATYAVFPFIAHERRAVRPNFVAMPQPSVARN